MKIVHGVMLNNCTGMCLCLCVWLCFTSRGRCWVVPHHQAQTLEWQLFFLSCCDDVVFSCLTLVSAVHMTTSDEKQSVRSPSDHWRNLPVFLSILSHFTIISFPWWIYFNLQIYNESLRPDVDVEIYITDSTRRDNENIVVVWVWWRTDTR